MRGGRAKSSLKEGERNNRLSCHRTPKEGTSQGRKDEEEAGKEDGECHPAHHAGVEGQQQKLWEIQSQDKLTL